MQEPWKEGTRPWWEKGYAAWVWVTADQVVSVVPSELVYAALMASAAATATIYNGVSDRGDVVAILQTTLGEQIKLDPPEPIICRRGIYVVDVADGFVGVFVMWRPLPAGWRP